MHYPCSENKGADQLHSYREADLRLCFRICKKAVFSRRGSYITLPYIQCFLLSNKKHKFMVEILRQYLSGADRGVHIEQAVFDDKGTQLELRHNKSKIALSIGASDFLYACIFLIQTF